MTPKKSEPSIFRLGMKGDITGLKSGGGELWPSSMSPVDPGFVSPEAREFMNLAASIFYRNHDRPIDSVREMILDQDFCSRVCGELGNRKIAAFSFEMPEVFLAREFRRNLIKDKRDLELKIHQWIELSGVAKSIGKKYENRFLLIPAGERNEIPANFPVFSIFGDESEVIEEVSIARIKNIILGIVRGLSVDLSAAHAIYNELISEAALKGTFISEDDAWRVASLAFAELEVNFSVSMEELKDSRCEHPLLSRQDLVRERDLLCRALEESHIEVECLSAKLFSMRHDFEIKITDLSRDIHSSNYRISQAEEELKKALKDNDELSRRVQLSNEGVRHRESENEFFHQLKVEKQAYEAEAKLLRERFDNLQIELEAVLLGASSNLMEMARLSDKADLFERTWFKFQPEDLWIDLRKEEEVGINWYPAELDGRWTGPGSTSVVKIPPLAAGIYQLELEIVDCVDADLIDEVKLFFNCFESFNKKFEWLSGDKGRFPCIASAKIECRETGEHGEIALNVPFVQRPFLNSYEDFRLLGVRVKNIRIVKLPV